MKTIPISVPDELEESIREFKLDLDEIATRAIFDRAEALRKLKSFSSRVKVSDKAAKEFTDKISESVARKFREAK